MNYPLPGSSGESLRCHRKQVKVPVDCGRWSKLDVSLYSRISFGRQLCKTATRADLLRIQKVRGTSGQGLREGKHEFRGAALRESPRGLLLSRTVTQKFRATVSPGMRADMLRVCGRPVPGKFSDDQGLRSRVQALRAG